jgi:hypothetical protein
VLSYLAAFRIPLKAITPWGGEKNWRSMAAQR